MTLEQYLALVSAYDPTDVRRAMAAVLADGRPRTPSEYRCFYTAVCLHLAIYRDPVGRPRRARMASVADDRVSRQVAPSPLHVAAS